MNQPYIYLCHLSLDTYFWLHKEDPSPCCMQAFSSYSEQRLHFIVLQGILIMVASLVAVLGIWITGSVAVVHGFGCSTACGIFSDRGLNPCPLHWQMDS